jgi:hypothetical protein
MSPTRRTHDQRLATAVGLHCAGTCSYAPLLVPCGMTKISWQLWS